MKSEPGGVKVIKGVGATLSTDRFKEASVQLLLARIRGEESYQRIQISDLPSLPQHRTPAANRSGGWRRG